MKAKRDRDVDGGTENDEELEEEEDVEEQGVGEVESGSDIDEERDEEGTRRLSTTGCVVGTGAGSEEVTATRRAVVETQVEKETWKPSASAERERGTALRSGRGRGPRMEIG